MNNKNQKDKKEYTVSKGSLILRVVVSAYLLYTVFQLSSSMTSAVGNDKIVIIIAMIVFTLVAVPLGGMSIRALTNGRYAGSGVSDDEESEIEETEREEAETEKIEASRLDENKDSEEKE